MSKRSRKEKDIKAETVKTITHEASTVYLAPLSNSVKLQSLNALLLLAYLKDAFQGKTIKVNDTLQVSLYGHMEPFKITSVEPSIEEDQVISKRTSIQLLSLGSLE